MQIFAAAVLFAALAFHLARANTFTVWGGPSKSLVFTGALHDYLSFGIKYSAVEFPDLPVEKRKEWIPVDEGANPLNEATEYYLDACENAKSFDTAKAAEAECAKTNCGMDYFIIDQFGIFPGMQFVRDGILFMSCGVAGLPTRCTDNATSCDSKEATLLVADDVSASVQYMQSLGNTPKKLTRGASSIKKMKKELTDYAVKHHRKIKLPV